MASKLTPVSQDAGTWGGSEYVVVWTTMAWMFAKALSIGVKQPLTPVPLYAECAYAIPG